MRKELALGLTIPLLFAATGCRCSKDQPAPTSESLAKQAPSSTPTPSPTTSASAGPQAPATQPLTPASGKLKATAVLTDPPGQHIGEQDVPLEYYAHRVRGASIVSQGGTFYKLEGDSLIEQAGGDGLGTHRLEGPGLIGPLWLDVTELAGSWPSELWASAEGMWVSDGARIYSGFSSTYHGSANDFTLVEEGGTHYDTRTLAAWSGGRVIGVEGGAFRVLSGPKNLVPKPALGAGVDCPTRVKPESIAALPSGELYAIGRGQCDDGAYLVERWQDDSAESKAVDRLPPYFSTELGRVAHPTGVHERTWLVAASKDAVYALRSAGDKGPGKSRLARFDGTKWLDLGLPLDQRIERADAAPDGSLWLIIGRTPFVFDARRGWREVSLPSAPSLPADYNAGAPKGRVDLNSVLAFSTERAFFGAKVYYEDTSFEGGLMLSTDATPLKLVSLGKGAAKPNDAGSDAGAAPAADAGPTTLAPTPFTPACTTPFVILFTVSKAAPPDFDYPATRDALLAANPRPDVKFVEFTYKGGRTLGASATSVEQAKALVTLIADRVKGSKPTLVCHAPGNVIRTVKF